MDSRMRQRRFVFKSANSSDCAKQRMQPATCEKNRMLLGWTWNKPVRTPVSRLLFRSHIVVPRHGELWKNLFWRAKKQIAGKKMYASTFYQVRNLTRNSLNASPSFYQWPAGTQ
jgi:hypothetical protein